LRKVLALLPGEWNQEMQQPYSVKISPICWPLGYKQSMQSDENCHKLRQAYLLEDTAPPTLKDDLSDDYSSGGMVEIKIEAKTGLRVLPQCQETKVISKSYALWPRTLEPWLAVPFRRESILPKFSPKCHLLQTNSQLRITGIHEGATLYPEPSNHQLPNIQLTLEGAVGQVYWFVNGVLQQNNAYDLFLKALKSDNYKVTVIDDSGHFSEINFSVNL
jgi:penicillin-binding protein 1C